MEDNLIKLLHFEKFKPICPRCKQINGQEYFLEIRSILKKQDDDSIVEGILLCSNKQCMSEYPIIDGIPIIVANLRTYISQSIIPILGRNDFSDTMESLVGDCFGPGSLFDSHRQQLSVYCFDHYGDFDPKESQESPVLPGAVSSLLKQGILPIKDKIDGPVIDIGCSVGRTTFDLAETIDDIVLGVDLNFGMVKIAASVLNNGRVNYPKRRSGIIFDRRDFQVSFEKSKHVDFWVCDATDLPFSGANVSFGLSLNVVDCISSPYDHLKELSKILKPDGIAVISTPYDWTISATPVESWIGGHSQRSENQGSSDIMLRSLLAGGGHPNVIEQLEILSEIEQIPWTLRLHERSSMKYMVHILTLHKKSDGI
ncbi:MAG: methyltransferase domain-containing protein [Desulfobacterales bacterium]|nr:methyltransferase domain-containing protein [Desulfobacterales bacterium]